MRSNTIFAAGIVAASSVIAAPLNARADNGPLLPTTTASQAALTTETTGPLIPTTSASQAAQTTETTGPLIPTTSASQSALTTETTGPLIPTTTASGSASASGTASSSSSVSQGTQSSTGSGTASSSGTATGTSTASSSGTATNSASSTGTVSSASTGTGTASSTVTASSSGTATGTASSTVTGSATGSSSTSATGTNTHTSTGPAPPVTTGPAPPVTTETPPPQVLTVLTTITDDFTSYVTYVPVTVTGNAAPTVTVTETVTVDGNGNGCTPTGTSTQVAPPAQSTNPSGGSSFYPSAIYHYDVSTGAVTCGVEDGLIEKFPTNKGHDITTLVTFTYPEESAGKKCQFEFFLSSASTLEGSGKIDVFTSLNPAPGCKASWPPGNQRNVHAGRLSAHVGAFASWDATYGASYLTEPTDCKAPGTQEGIELVSVYDEDHVAWFPDGSGARIIYN